MTHAPRFWAEKLPRDLRPIFWALVNDSLTADGESTYWRVLRLYGESNPPQKTKSAPGNEETK